jgi:membrane AbrB-like protein
MIAKAEHRNDPKLASSRFGTGAQAQLDQPRAPSVRDWPVSRFTPADFPLGRFALALTIGTAGGGSFYFLGIPLPFMLGSMVACAVTSIAGLPVRAPMAVRPPMSAVIGAVIGASVSPAALAHLPSMGWSMLFLVAFMITGGAVSALYFYRVIGFDLRTACFAGMPGGLIDMVTLADEHGGDPRKVAIVHTLRVMLVVFTVPFLVLTLTGAERVPGFNMASTLADIDRGFLLWFPVSCVAGTILGAVLRLPARYFVGPMLVSAAIHVTGVSNYKLPFEMLIVAQIVLGATIGCRFVGTPPREIAAVAVASIGSTALLLVIGALFAWLTTLLSPLGFLAVFLSYAPGGLAEISLLALALQIETAIVTAHHIVRIILVGFGTSAVLAVARRYARMRQDG